MIVLSLPNLYFEMGSSNSRDVSKQPGKSVMTQDTLHIDEYDDDWFENQPNKDNKTSKKASNGQIIHKTETNNNVQENQPIKANETSKTNGQMIHKTETNKNAEEKQLKNGNVSTGERKSVSGNSKHITVISNNKTANTVHRPKVVTPSTVMNMVDLEEYD
ncbi:Hypothetical predicted protein [Mytilus galloprovincialis]|uniref:Uncharacterized protein n=2 Tax=Mytilus galloprovincialis TaxID=29158 RepID=A0A8B6G3S6_MYTGA|nr:Hypothetical predicted protein [Mytilus galloprovincialis]